MFSRWKGTRSQTRKNESNVKTIINKANVYEYLCLIINKLIKYVSEMTKKV